MLLALVGANPSLPQSMRDNATQVAQHAIATATASLASNGQGTASSSAVQAPSATFDQSSLSAISGNPIVITGTASNESEVVIAVAGSGATLASVPVVNGRWSATLPAFVPGSYSLEVHVPGGFHTVLTTGVLIVSTTNLLTTGSLTITGASSSAPVSSQSTQPSTSQAQPTCALTASSLKATFGQTVILAWTSKNATSVSWLHANKAMSPLGDPSALNSSAPLVVDEYGDPYAQLNVSGPGGTYSCAVSISVPPSAAAATIDAASLTTSLAMPTLTGTVTNASVLSVSIDVGTSSVVNLPVSISNGRWSATVPLAQQKGTYPVTVINIADGLTLTTGTLTVQ
jgi:hypothetical protein